MKREIITQGLMYTVVTFFVALAVPVLRWLI